MRFDFMLLAAILVAGSALAGTAVAQEVASPRAQMADGVAAEEVACKSDLELLIKNNGDAICVSAQTAERLIAAGFANPVGSESGDAMDEDAMDAMDEESMGAMDEESMDAMDEDAMDAMDEESMGAMDEESMDAMDEDAMDAMDEESMDADMMYDDPTTHPLAEQARQVALDAIALYKTDGMAALEATTASAADLEEGQLYPFILESDGFTIVAHGADPSQVGSYVYDIVTFDKTQDEILIDLENGLDTWVKYEFVNPDTGMDQSKRSVLYLHDNYVFGSGYYLGS